MDDLIAGFYSLASRINKRFGGRDTSADTIEGVVSDYLPELSLKMDPAQLLSLTGKWEKKWNESAVKASWLKQCDDNEKYWKGEQFSRLETEAKRPLIDNLVFEGTETFLPAATRQNPEPLVELRASEKKDDKGLKYADIIRHRLSDWADDIKLRLKIKKAGRHWFISLIGVAKMGWDLTNNRPACKIIRPKKLILDPDGINDEDGYQGKYVGEYRKMEASILVKIIENDKSDEAVKAIDAIKKLVKNDMGTDVQFIEWWTEEYMCWTMDNTVLLKKKNPHWNYDQESPTAASMDTKGEEPADIDEPSETKQADGSIAPDAENGASEPTAPGADVMEPDEEADMPENGDYAAPAAPTVKAQNHLPAPRVPYIFITIFNLGKQPVDETSLITQVLPQQDVVNKRNKQIDKNADSMNNGVVVSEERSGLTKQEAQQVTEALRRGGTIVIPSGAPQEAVWKFNVDALPADVYNNLNDNRQRFREILGIYGMSPAGIKNEDTARGKILVRGLDVDRIGGGITEYFEQFADDIFNYAVQLMYVYDDIFVNNQGAVLPKIKVSVKEGSMLPKDATTKANQAIDLASAGKMSLIDLYKALEYPNPDEMAANLWLELNAPEVVFKDNPKVQQALAIKAQMAQGAGKKPPSESMNFKDLPPEGKAQMAAQAGINLDPTSVALHDASKEAAKNNNSQGSSGPPRPDLSGSSLLAQVPTGTGPAG